jgi:signal transduction histidine kinase
MFLAESQVNAKVEKYVAGAGSTMTPADPSGLIAHIQGAMELQKAALARELHDELGGLLVGAVMDLAWAEQHPTAPPAELRQKLVRARQTLAAAIDLKRKLIEDLRPTLLDNVGLFAALRWHVQMACRRAGLNCNVQVPEDEPKFGPSIAITLFRIVQEALAVVVARTPVDSADFKVTLHRRTLSIELEGRAAAASAQTDAVPPPLGAEVHFLAAIEQRVASLSGEFQSIYLAGGVTRISARFPLESTVLPG